MTDTTGCRTEGCPKRPVARKMCGTCYTRWTRKVKKGTPCAGDGCDRNAIARGWCQKHYERWLNHGDANWQPPKPIEGCSIDGCERSHYARSWCRLHYSRWNKYGDPLGKATPKISKNLQKVYDTIEQQPAECVFMPGPPPNPNGSVQVAYNGKAEYAHRLVLKLTVGEPPEGTEACHSCGNGHLGCITPGHLRWDTHQANIEDKFAHGTMLRGEAHGQAKLTEADVRVIRTDRRSVAELADMYGVSYSAIDLIRKRKRWKHVE